MVDVGVIVCCTEALGGVGPLRHGAVLRQGVRGGCRWLAVALGGCEIQRPRADSTFLRRFWPGVWV